MTTHYPFPQVLPRNRPPYKSFKSIYCAPSSQPYSPLEIKKENNVSDIKELATHSEVENK
jgi:hypothetical protein